MPSNVRARGSRATRKDRCLVGGPLTERRYRDFGRKIDPDKSHACGTYELSELRSGHGYHGLPPLFFLSPLRDLSFSRGCRRGRSSARARAGSSSSGVACAGLPLATAVLDDGFSARYCERCRGVLLPRQHFAEVVQKRRWWARTPPASPVPSIDVSSRGRSSARVREPDVDPPVLRTGQRRVGHVQSVRPRVAGFSRAHADHERSRTGSRTRRTPLQKSRNRICSASCRSNLATRVNAEGQRTRIEDDD